MPLLKTVIALSLLTHMLLHSSTMSKFTLVKAQQCWLCRLCWHWHRRKLVEKELTWWMMTWAGLSHLVENLTPSVAVLLLPSVWSVGAVVDVDVTTCKQMVSMVYLILCNEDIAALWQKRTFYETSPEYTILFSPDTSCCASIDPIGNFLRFWAFMPVCILYVYIVFLFENWMQIDPD